MNDESVSSDELRQKVQEYGTFIDETLHPELKRAVKAREETEHDIADYRQLCHKLRALDKRKDADPLESLVDLGYEAVYCRAVIDETTKVFVEVGMGFQVEFTLKEAVVFIETKRIPFLEQRLEKRAEKARMVASHLESSLLILETLAQDLRSREGEA